MDKIFDEIVGNFQFIGDIGKDSIRLLEHYNRLRTAEHSQRVANECKRLANKYGVEEKAAEVAGYLHDISAIVPNEEKLKVAKDIGIEVLKEEREVPGLLHQKISAIMAQEIWGISDENTLDAISCHTTLKKGSSKLDKLLFIADKLQWDQDGEPPYLKEVKEGLETSLEKGVFAFIKHQMDNKENLMILHPWLAEAYEDLKNK